MEGKGLLASGRERSYRWRMSETIPESWRPVLEPALATEQARRLGGWLRHEEAAGKAIYPPRGCRLRALELRDLLLQGIVAPNERNHLLRHLMQRSCGWHG